MKVIFSQECLGYTSPGHPESPERVRLCYEELLANKKTLPIEFIAPKPCAEGDILLAHTKELLEKVRNEDLAQCGYIECSRQQ